MALPIASAAETTLRVHSGGGAFTDSEGKLWAADNYFNTGGTYTTGAAISNTANAPLYQSERYDPAGGAELTYSLPVTPGVYKVRLHFAEIYFNAANQRVFDVSIEGAVAFANLDIFAEAGAQNRALVKEYTVTVPDNILTVMLVHKIENPKISSVEVIPGVAPAPAPALQASAASLGFGSVQVAQAASQNLTLTNTGTAPLSISALTLSGAQAAMFSVTPSAPLNLAPAASTVLQVGFTPSAIGAAAASLAIASNDPATPTRTIALSGTGFQPSPPVLGLSPTALNLGNVLVGATSSPINLVLSNTGGSNLIVSALTLSGANAAEFALTLPTLPLTLAPAATANVPVRLTPSAAGARAATLTLASNQAAGNATVALSGTGTLPPPPVLGLSASSLSFGTVVVGITSAPQTLTLSNTGGSNLIVTALSLSGANAAEFALTSPVLPLTLAPAATASVPVRLTASATGARAGILTVASNQAAGSVNVGLSGTGVTVQPTTLRIHSGGGAFTDTAGNLWAADNYFNTGGTFTSGAAISNTTNDALYQSERYDAAGGEELTYSLPVNPGSYKVRLHFAEIYFNAPNLRVFDVSIEGAIAFPNLDIFAQAGAQNRALVKEYDVTVSDNILTVMLIHKIENPKISSVEVIPGAPVVPAPKLAVSPASLSFGSVLVASNASLNLTVTNTGNAPLSLNGLSIAGAQAADFSLTSPVLPLTLAPSATTVIPVLYAPTAVGASAAVLTLASNDPISPSVNVPLSGTGFQPSPPALGLSASALNFGTLLIGNTSASTNLVLTNTGGSALIVSALSLSGAQAAEFGFTSPALPLTLAPAATATVPVTFTPAAPGARAATLTLVSNQPAGNAAVTLSGTGVAPSPAALSLSPASLAFGNVVIGIASAPANLVLTNSGASPLIVTALTLGGAQAGEFALTAPVLPLTLAPAATATVPVRLTASATGARTATLTVVSNQPAGNVSVPLSGTGVTVQPTTLRIHSGGGAFTDTDGKLWAADNYFNTGGTYTTGAAISNTLNAPLYQSERYDAAGGEELTYSLPVTPGSYKVRLHFAEIYFNAPNLRVFDVSIEGAIAFPNLDIFAQAGAQNRALVKEYDVIVTDNILTVMLIHKIENPKISSVEVIPGAPIVPAPKVAVSPASLPFGSVLVASNASLNLTVSNTGNAPLSLTALTVSGAQAADFSLTSPVLPLTVAPAASAVIPVLYAPTAVGASAATLTVATNDAATPAIAVALSGTGFQPSPPALGLSASALNLGSIPVGGASAPMNLVLTNTGGSALIVSALSLSGAQAAEFGFTSPALPLTLAPAATATVPVTFMPSASGARAATLTLVSNQPAGNAAVALTGSGVAPSPAALSLGASSINFGNVVVGTSPATSNLLLTNSGGSTLTVTGLSLSGSEATDFLLTGTILPMTLMPGENRNVPVSFMPAALGARAATLTIASSQPAGNILVPLSGTGAAVQPTVIRVHAGGDAFTDDEGNSWSADNYFNTGSTFSVGNPIDGTLNDILYQTERYDVAGGDELIYSIPVTPGPYTVRLHFAENYVGAAGARVFDVTVEDQVAFPNFDIYALAGAKFRALVKEYDVTVSDNILSISLLHKVENPKICGIEVIPAVGGHVHPFLHVVIESDAAAVDYDNDGMETVHFNGSPSHTHEFGHALVSRQWSLDGAALIDAVSVDIDLPLGDHDVGLTIADNNTPPETLTGHKQVKVSAPDLIPGALALFHKSANPAALLNATLPKADYAKILPTLIVTPATVPEAPYLVSVQARVLLGATGQYTFSIPNAAGSSLLVNGAPADGPIDLPAGFADLEARFVVLAGALAPLQVSYSLGISAPAAIPPSLVFHDETDLPPVVNSHTVEGPVTGFPMTISGMGFFPANQVFVTLNGQVIQGSDLHRTPTTLTFTTPPGTGEVTGTVTSPNGTSLPFQVAYSTGGATNIGFTSNVIATMPSPTQAVWGPDGRLYVTSILGVINAYTLDDNYQITATQTINTLVPLAEKEILGIAFNPLDHHGPIKMYIAHALLHGNGGTCFTGTSEYNGRISVLTGPDFATAVPVITGLPTSNHDHGVSGIEFDNHGDLLIAIGGTSNAGVANCALGGLPESPLSAAILKAELSDPDFNGTITYTLTSTGAPNMDQVQGERVDAVPGIGISVYASGLRNAYDLALTTYDKIFATDNGPNAGFGEASTGPTSQGAHPQTDDELNLVVEGAYYGHPNRNRGRSDARQNVYRGVTEPGVPGVFNQALLTIPASTNGITEYRSQTFGGAMRGNLLMQKWNGDTYRVALGADNQSVMGLTVLPAILEGLDVATGPGGILISADYTDNTVVLAKPVNAGTGLQVYDIFPWRGTVAGGTPFEIGGSDFGNMGNTTVTIGGTMATLTSVSPTRIKGILPLHANPSTALEDVAVTVNATTKVLPMAFRYLAHPSH